jgi:hypothetical protein
MIFDWGLNQSCSTHLPVKIDWGETKYFDVSFTADIDDAKTWGRTYKTHIRYNYTSVDEGEDTKDFYYYYQYYDLYFVVWSQDQKDAMDLARTYEAYADAYPAYYFSSIQGRLSASQAAAEASQGDTLWGIGNFTAAKTHYQNAVNDYDDAFAAEEDKGIAIEDAQLNATIVGADAAKKTADAAMLQAQGTMNQAYGYILLGLGFLLIGVGAILYGIRKPKPA